MKKLFLLCLMVSSSALGHEGMWLPEQLPQIADQLKAAGLKLNPKSLSRLADYPMGAIVSINGCSASFVSPEGLLVTNYHCAYPSIEHNSTPDRDLVRTGFLASSTATELPAVPGSRALVTVKVLDVSSYVIDAATAKLAGKGRYDAMESNEKKIVAGCERQTGYRCSVYSFYGGLQFLLIIQLEIRDMRLVYAPSGGVGRFGGDTDNWMWPRHTGDFSFFRMYVGKQGRPADFSPDNVPYRPTVHLNLARRGVNEGDFVMVAGYPGRTSRQRLPAEIEFSFGWLYPASMKAASERLDIIARETQGRRTAEISYASTVASINNGYKKDQGLLASYAKADLLLHKDRQFADIKAWVHADSARETQFANDIDSLEKLIAERNTHVRREFLLGYAAPRFLSVARTLYLLANERAQNEDLARRPGYQARDWSRIKEGLEAIDKRYDEQVDKALVLPFLAQYLALPLPEQDGVFVAALGLRPGMREAQIKSQLDRLYAGSRLGEKAWRLTWADRDIAAFKASEDSFIQAAVALYADDNALDDRDKELGGKIQQAYAGYMKALILYKNAHGEVVYPDANGTLRVTFGNVAGRTVGNTDGTAWAPFTSLRGIVAKNTGAGEFDAPPAQLAAINGRKFDDYYMAQLDSVPVDFLTTLDITGGNSGSPVLNSHAELVGLAFDGTQDTVISDWDFNPVTTRAIAVDVRYMLWQMKVVDHADRLLDEMRMN